MASLSSNVTHMPLSYHEVTALRLPLVTAAGLQAAGIPLEALGTRDGKVQVLSSCFTLSPFAKEILPPSLGGTAGESSIRLSPASAEFVRKVWIASPIKPTVSGGFSVDHFGWRRRRRWWRGRFRFFRLHLVRAFLPRHALRPSASYDYVDDVCIRVGRYYGQTRVSG